MDHVILGLFITHGYTLESPPRSLRVHGGKTPAFPGIYAIFVDSESGYHTTEYIHPGLLSRSKDEPHELEELCLVSTPP